MTLFVDPRRGSKELIPLLKKIAQQQKAAKGTVKSKLMLSGDAAWEGAANVKLTGKPKRYCVEYKHLNDVLDCIQRGRFVTQLRRMQQESDCYWLLIGDEFRATKNNELELKKLFGKYVSHWMEPFASRHNPVTYCGLIGWLTTMELPGGCHLWSVPSDQQAAWWIWGKYVWSQKRDNQHKSLNMFDSSRPAPSRDHRGVRFIGKPNEVARTANALVDGIGWEKAKRLGRRFGCVEEFIAADSSELQSVKGIGRKLAQDIIAARKKKTAKTAMTAKTTKGGSK